MSSKKSIAQRALAGFMVAAALTAAPSRAQEPSVVLKSLDNLEKRVAKVEGDLGRLRKAAPAPAAADPSRDTALTALRARVESLASRLETLEHPAPKPGAAVDSLSPPVPGKVTAASPAQAPAHPLDAEIRSLIAEVKSLSARIQGGASAGAHPAGEPPVAPGGAAAPAMAAAKAEAAKPPKAGREAKPALALKADIQIQGERKLTSQENRDNLDDFWGRVNFGAEYKAEDFQSKVNLRVFPEGFGFEPLTGATFDTTGQGSLKVQTQSQTRLVVNHAWARFLLGDYGLKIGRFETMETHSDNFGNYIDLGPSGKFMSRPAAHNAVEVTRAFGPASLSSLLGTSDRRLNRGFLRLFGRYEPSKSLQATLGWRANLFDAWKYEDEEILHRFDAGFLAALPRGWQAFAESALLQASGREDDTPVLVGIRPPAGPWLDVLSLEAEWMPTRQVAKEDKPLLFNLHARKTLGRFKLDFGLWSDLADADADSWAAGVRLTSGLN